MDLGDKRQNFKNSKDPSIVRPSHISKCTWADCLYLISYNNSEIIVACNNSGLYEQEVFLLT
jgi:hypothetical protein